MGVDAPCDQTLPVTVYIMSVSGTSNNMVNLVEHDVTSAGSLDSSVFLRIQQLKDLGEIDEPKWDGLRCDVITHCNLLIGCYQETLTELNRLPGTF